MSIDSGDYISWRFIESKRTANFLHLSPRVIDHAVLSSHVASVDWVRFNVLSWKLPPSRLLLAYVSVLFEMEQEIENAKAYLSKTSTISNRNL